MDNDDPILNEQVSDDEEEDAEEEEVVMTDERKQQIKDYFEREMLAVRERAKALEKAQQDALAGKLEKSPQKRKRDNGSAAAAAKGKQVAAAKVSKKAPAPPGVKVKRERRIHTTTLMDFVATGFLESGDKLFFKFNNSEEYAVSAVNDDAQIQTIDAVRYNT